jgi:TusA-related sulfurtransferase
MMITGMLSSIVSCSYKMEQAAPQSVQQDNESNQLYNELKKAVQELDQLSSGMAVEASFDCPQARELTGRICLLSDKICRIYRQNQHDQKIQSLCEDGHKRCLHAKQRTEQVCPKK